MMHSNPLQGFAPTTFLVSLWYPLNLCLRLPDSDTSLSAFPFFFFFLYFRLSLTFPRSLSLRILLILTFLKLLGTKSPGIFVCMTNWAEVFWYSASDDPWALQLTGCEEESLDHPSRDATWLISNLLVKWVSCLASVRHWMGPAYLAAYTGKSLIWLYLGCGRVVLIL